MGSKLVRRLVVATAATVIGALGVVIAPGVASAQDNVNLWVNNTVTSVGGLGRSCTQPGFSSVQAAVNEAESYYSEATVLVCPGTYHEQVQATGSTTLTIEAAIRRLGATLALPATPVNSTTPCDTAPGTGSYQPDQDGLAVCGTVATTVTVKGLTFDEAWPTGTCDDSLYGILVGGNDTLRLVSSAVVAAGAQPINGCQGGVGIQVGMAWTSPVERGHLYMVGTRISGYQKNGLTIDGAGSTAKVTYSTVQGAGRTIQTAQNGIQVSNGAYATILHTTVAGNECDNATCGPNSLTQYQAGGILFFGARSGSSVISCRIEQNDYGIYFYSQQPTLSSSVENSIKFSTLNDNRYENVLLDQGRDLVASDHIFGGNVGIEALQYNGQSYGAFDAVDSSQVHGVSLAAVEVLSDQAPSGDKPGAIDFQGGSLSGPVLSNSSSYTLHFGH